MVKQAEQRVLIVCVALDVQRVFITNGIVEFFDEDRVAQRKRSILFVWGLGNEQRKVVIEKRWAKRALLKRIR
tara:strand:- start:893 stop:1111 length:219 start_codon:yes stop_codon:yes gene_type:complete